MGHAPSVWAQSADATLRGKAKPSTEVTARNVATGGVRHTTSTADGTYVIVGLPPGVYRVDAGSGTEQVLTLSVASTSTLDLTGAAAPEAMLADITVHSSRIAEVRTSEVGTLVSLDQIQTVPQLTRNFLEFADVVPGVVFNVGPNGKTSIRGGAQNENSVNVYIDGVGQKGYVRSGLSGQTDNTQGNPFPQLAIGEYKVITSNYKAEYDQISSAAITAETKSGTNKFEGEAFVTYTHDKWRAETPGELAAGQKTPSQDREFGVAVGGPIIENVLHFFATYEGKRYTTPATVTANNAPVAILAALPADAKAQLGPVTLPFEENLYFAKLDWEPSADDRFVMSAKIRQETGLGDQAGRGNAASASIQTKNTDNRWEARWQHSATNYFNEALVTYEDAFFIPHGKSGSSNGATYTYNLGPGNDPTILATNGVDPRANQNKGQKGYAFADDITWSHINWLTGDHTIKAGVKYKVVKLTAQDAGGDTSPIFFYDVTATGAATIPWKTTFGAPVPGYSPTVVSNDRQFGIYLQDDWQTTNKLTLNLGVRYDIEWNPSYLDFKTPQFFIDQMNTVITPNANYPNLPAGTTYGQSLGLSSDPNVRVNINDYISNGHNRTAYKGEIQPRLGFSYDLFEDQKHVIFGGIGRAYDRNLYDYLQLEQTKFVLSEPSLRINTTDHPCSPSPTNNCVNWNPAFLNGPSALQAVVAGKPGEIYLMNNKLKVPYSDQFTVGIRNKLGDWNTSVSVARILSKDGLQFTLGNRYPDGTFYTGNSQPWCCGPPGGGGNLIIASNGIETRTTQFLLSAEKPFSEESGWGSTLAYTYTDAVQNRDINEHYVFDSPTVKLFPFITSNAAAKHRFVATGTVAAPWGLVIGAKLTIATPIPHNDIQCCTFNPLYPTGGPAYPASVTASGLGIRTLDMQVTKTFKIQDAFKLYLRMDVLNVTNSKNLIDYNLNFVNGKIVSGSYNPNGNIEGTTRQLRLTLGGKF